MSFLLPLTVDDLSQEELKKIHDELVELRGNPLKGFKKFFSTIFKPFYKRDSIDATYVTFKAYFDMVGLPFTRKDAEVVRTNMLRLSDKLYDIHMEQTEEIDAELERRQKNE